MFCYTPRHSYSLSFLLPSRHSLNTFLSGQQPRESCAPLRSATSFVRPHADTRRAGCSMKPERREEPRAQIVVGRRRMVMLGARTPAGLVAKRRSRITKRRRRKRRREREIKERTTRVRRPFVWSRVPPKIAELLFFSEQSQRVSPTRTEKLDVETSEEEGGGQRKTERERERERKRKEQRGRTKRIGGDLEENTP